MDTAFDAGVGFGCFARPASRAEQSRINGSKSQGPVTAEGKAASARNALKHGMYSRAVLLPGEDVQEFDAFVFDLQTELCPFGTLQKTLVQRAAEISWKLRRLPAVEGAILESARVRYEQQEAEEEDEEYEGGGAGENPGGIGDLLHQLVGKEEDGIMLRLQRYEVRLEKSLERSLRELRLLKRDAAGDSGSFGTASNAHGQPSVGLRGKVSDRGAAGGREAASVVQAASPARGPSAAPQDDGSASGSSGEARSSAGGTAAGGTGDGGLGLFRTKQAAIAPVLAGSLGSFGSKAGVAGQALGSFRTNDPANEVGLGSFRTNDVTMSAGRPASGSFGAKGAAALRRAARAAAPSGKMA